MPALWAKAKHAICLANPKICEMFRLIESNNESATWRVKRAGQEPQDFTYTIEDARLAGRVKPGSAWATNPRRMLEARAKGHAADVVFPDLVGGFATGEDVQDERIVVTQPNGQAKTESIAEVVVDVKPRDTEAEMNALKEDILNAKTKEQSAAVRKSVAKFIDDVGGSQGEELKAFYNMNKPGAKVPPPEAAPLPREPGVD